MINGTRILNELSTAGFCIVRAPRTAACCRSAVKRWAGEQAFRFPLHPQPASQSSNFDGITEKLYRLAFNSLYALSVRCLHELGASNSQLKPLQAHQDMQSQSTPVLPFKDPHSPAPALPFEYNSSLPYAASFASIFNFNHGFLNAHRDRGLLTAVYGQLMSRKNPSGRVSDRVVRLWGQTPGSTEWRMLDPVPDDSVILFAGEQLARLSNGAIPAMLHACRVDPTAERISMLHHGAHPGAREEGNRQSCALVLAMDEEV